MGEKLEIASKAYLSPLGITRAETKLYLTAANARTIFGRMGFNAPSRFLKELSDEVLEHLSHGGTSSDRERLPFGGNNQARFDRAPRKRTLGEVQKPATQISRLQSTGGAQLDWKAGDKAVHGKWGTGMVVSVRGTGDDTELDIAFPQPVGIKRLLAKFAPITKG